MIVLAVSGSFVLIEAIVLAATFFNQQNILRNEYATRAQSQIGVAKTLAPPFQDSAKFIDALQMVAGKTNIVAARYLPPDGSEPSGFGVRPSDVHARLAESDESGPIFQPNGGLLDVALRVGADGSEGIIVVSMDASDMSARLWGFAGRTIMVVILIGIGVTTVTLILLNIGVVSPMMKIKRALAVLNRLDAELDIPVQKKNEIGDVARAVRDFRKTLMENERLRADREEVVRKSEIDRKNALRAMASQFDGQVADVVQTVASTATNMQESAQKMEKTARGASEQSLTVAGVAEEASASVSSVATAAEQLTASIAEITEQVARSSDKATDAVSEANRVNTDVYALSKAAHKIGEVVKLINEIAEQTNLLALNATIEAARAGDAGKGFAVVASEVKSLANQTARATGEISSQVVSIQSATERTVTSIGGIGEVIGELNEIATGIAAAMEEQGSATDRIAENIGQVAKATQEVSETVAALNMAAQDTRGIAETVLDSSGRMNDQSMALKHEVENFLGEIRQS